MDILPWPIVYGWLNIKSFTCCHYLNLWGLWNIVHTGLKHRPIIWEGGGGGGGGGAGSTYPLTPPLIIHPHFPSISRWNQKKNYNSTKLKGEIIINVTLIWFEGTGKAISFNSILEFSILSDFKMRNVIICLELGINEGSFGNLYPFQKREGSLFKYYPLPFYKMIRITVINTFSLIHLFIYSFIYWLVLRSDHSLY